MVRPKLDQPDRVLHLWKFPNSSYTRSSSMTPVILLCSLLFMSLDTLKKREIEMKPNQAYETVIRPQPATQVNIEPDYEDVAQVHHWIWMYATVFECCFWMWIYWKWYYRCVKILICPTLLSFFVQWLNWLNVHCHFLKTLKSWVASCCESIEDKLYFCMLCMLSFW